MDTNRALLVAKYGQNIRVELEDYSDVIFSQNDEGVWVEIGIVTYSPDGEKFNPDSRIYNRSIGQMLHNFFEAEKPAFKNALLQKLWRHFPHDSQEMERSVILNHMRDAGAAYANRILTMMISAD